MTKELTDREKKFLEWRDLATDLKDIKFKEMRLRKDLAQDILTGLVPPYNNKLSINGIPIIVENTVAHNLDKEVVNQIFEDLSLEEKSAMKFTPELKLREYKKLPKESLLHEAVTVKPSAPTIKIS